MKLDEPETESEDRVPAPAVRALAPILMAPKLPPIEPEDRAPTEVRDEPVTPLPRVVASRTRALLINRAEPEGKLILPAVRVMPPAKEEVALFPTIEVVAVEPT